MRRNRQETGEQDQQLQLTSPTSQGEGSYTIPFAQRLTCTIGEACLAQVWGGPNSTTDWSRTARYDNGRTSQAGNSSLAPSSACRELPRERDSMKRIGNSFSVDEFGRNRSLAFAAIRCTDAGDAVGIQTCVLTKLLKLSLDFACGRGRSLRHEVIDTACLSEGARIGAGTM